MKTLRTISIYLLVLCTTFYVGIGVFQFICPFDQHFSTIEFAKYWKVVDGYMGKRMSIFMPIWLLVMGFSASFSRCLAERHSRIELSEYSRRQIQD